VRFANRFTSASRTGRWRWLCWAPGRCAPSCRTSSRPGDARWFPGLVLVALLAVLVAIDPGRIDRDATWLRVMKGTVSPGPACCLRSAGTTRQTRIFPDVVRTGADMAKPGSRPARDLCLQPRQCQRRQERPRVRQSRAEQCHQQRGKVRQRREVSLRVAVGGTTVLTVQPGHRDQLRARPASPNCGRGIRLIGDDRSRR